jgi:UDP-glucose 4-epimerase
MKIMISGTSGFVGGSYLRSLEKLENIEHRTIFSSTGSIFPGDIERRGEKIIIPKESLEYVAETQVLVHIGSFTPRNKFFLNHLNEYVNSLEISRKLFFETFPNLKKIILASTMDVYDRTSNIINEESNVSLNNAYVASKLFSERYAKLASEDKKIELDIFRIGHVYGEGDSKYQKLLPNLIKAFKNETKFQLKASLTQELNLIFVQDVVNVLLQSTLAPKGFGITNLVSSRNIQVKDLINFFQEETGKLLDLEILDNEGNSFGYNFDNKKLRTDFVFEETPINIGLKSYLGQFGYDNLS